MPKFIPNWDIQYLYSVHDNKYCVIKKPEAIPGDGKKTLMVREGCTVFADGRWFYWRLMKPVSFGHWKDLEGWSDRLSADPDKIVAAKLNGGVQGVIPAPQFKAREDNNWVGQHPIVVPNHLTSEMLDDLVLAHQMLCDELQEGKPLAATT